LKKEQTIIRRNQIKIKYSKRENNFNIDILKREIFQIQKGNNIRNIFREDLRNQEVNFYER
jgi:hypothetical protein